LLPDPSMKTHQRVSSSFSFLSIKMFYFSVYYF
jgi:hypothetical protein